MEIPLQDNEDEHGATHTPAFQVAATRKQIHQYLDLEKEPSYMDYRRWQAALQDRVVRIVHLAHACFLSTLTLRPC
jgi:hypothetical protein